MHSSSKSPALTLLKTFILTALAGGTMAAQTQHTPLDANSLRKREPKVTSVYNTVEFKEAYSTARALYRNTKSAAEWTPVPFNPKKPFEWFMPIHLALEKFAKDVNLLEDQLLALEQDPEIQKNPQKLGQLQAIEDDFTRSSLESSNRLVVGLNLGIVFIKNNMVRQAGDWYPMHVPFGNTQMSLVSRFVTQLDIEMCSLPDTKFWKGPAVDLNGNRELDANGNPVRSSSEIVNNTVEELYEHLARARSTIDQEGLLKPNDNLRQTASIPKPVPAVASIAVR